eukprot:COSAG02_NODE_23712_length_710_cov_1.121113_2_plen_80_part_00
MRQERDLGGRLGLAQRMPADVQALGELRMNVYYMSFAHFRICTFMPVYLSYVCPVHRLKFTVPRDYAYMIIRICPSIRP